jgi:hypothetical protein
VTTRERAWQITQQYLDGAHADEPPPDDLGDDQPPPDDADYRDPVEDDAQTQMRPVNLDDDVVDTSDSDRDDAVTTTDDHPTPQPTPAPTIAPSPLPEPPPVAPTPDRYKKPLAIGAVIATGALTVLGSCGLWAMRTGPHVAADQTGQDPTAVRVVAPPAPTHTADPNQDAPIPYRATAHGCLPGSTAGQSVAGDDHSQAWVCVLGGNHGQYLTLDLGKTAHVSAVAITAGWPGNDASGTDQWHQHLMPTKVQWSCNDVPPTVVAQDDIHSGETVKSFSGHGALCSEMTMIVQETSRVPVDVPVTSTSVAPGGPLDEILGPPSSTTSPAAPLLGLPGDKPPADPADNTFAVLSIKVLGHSPS